MKIDWIVYSERKPQEPNDAYGDKYICTVSNDQVVVLRYCKKIIRGKEVIRWEHNFSVSPWEPIAWSPFPEPYKA